MPDNGSALRKGESTNALKRAASQLPAGLAGPVVSRQQTYALLLLPWLEKGRYRHCAKMIGNNMPDNGGALRKGESTIAPQRAASQLPAGLAGPMVSRHTHCRCFPGWKRIGTDTAQK
jgi:hypothetical protein